MKIVLFSRPQVVLNLYEFCSPEHRRYFKELLVTTDFHRSTVKVNPSTYQHYFIGFHSIISLLWVNGCRNFVHQHFSMYFHSIFPPIFSLLLWKSMATATVFLPTFFHWLPYKKKKKRPYCGCQWLPQLYPNIVSMICIVFFSRSQFLATLQNIFCSTEERNSYRFGTVAAFHKTIGYGRAGMVIYQIY